MSLADIQSMKALKMAKQNANLKNGFDSYGFFVKPSDFTPTLPCNVWRDSSGNLYNDMNFSQYKTGTSIYVSASGSDSTGTGSSSAPYLSLNKALSVATAGSPTNYTIIVKGTTKFYRNQTFNDNGQTISGQTIAIVPDVSTTRIKITTHQNGLSWTNQGGGVWSAARSSVAGVYDLRYVDSNNVPIPLPCESSLTNCQSTPNSWYTDNTTIYVHSSDGTVPNDANWIISLNLTETTINLTNNATLYMENCDIIQGRDSHAFLPNGDPSTSSGTFVANNCTFVGGIARQVSAGTDGNAYAGTNLKNTYLFNCTAAYAGRDGFNHHFAGVANDTTRRNYFVFEFNCLSYNNGLLDTTDGNNNCFTCHEGVNVLRFGCTGYNSTGPVCADVMSCYTINVYCNMRDANWQYSTSNVCYYFDQTTPPTGVTGKVLLLNCTTSGDTKSTYQANFATNISVFMYGNKLTNLATNSATPINMI